MGLAQERFGPVERVRCVEGGEAEAEAEGAGEEGAGAGEEEGGHWVDVVWGGRGGEGGGWWGKVSGGRLGVFDTGIDSELSSAR